MPLTRPTVAQLNTVVTEISDPILVLNKGSTQANVDVGFVLNRDGGISPNVALYWNETTDSLVTAYTTSTGGINSNIAVSSYANLTTGNLTVYGNITTVGGYFVGDGSLLTGIVSGGDSSYGNGNVASYLPTYSGNIANIRLGVSGVLTFADGTTQTTAGGGSYSNVQVATYLPTHTGIITASNIAVNGNITAQYFYGNGSQITGLPTGYSNVQVATYLPTHTGVITSSNVFVTGNITAQYFIGDGSQLSGVITSVTKIINGTSDITAYSGGNIAVTVGGTANTILFTNSITSTSNVTGALRVSGLGGIGVGGNLYVGQRVGYVWGANNVSSVYQIFNNSTNSLDTVFV
jgi:hypothetical protein